MNKTVAIWLLDGAARYPPNVPGQHAPLKAIITSSAKGAVTSVEKASSK